jgi:hypothetical protein
MAFPLIESKSFRHCTYIAKPGTARISLSLVTSLSLSLLDITCIVAGHTREESGSNERVLEVLRPHSIDDNCQQVTHSRCEPRRLGLHEARILQEKGSASAEGPRGVVRSQPNDCDHTRSGRAECLNLWCGNDEA